MPEVMEFYIPHSHMSAFPGPSPSKAKAKAKALKAKEAMLGGTTPPPFLWPKTTAQVVLEVQPLEKQAWPLCGHGGHSKQWVGHEEDGRWKHNTVLTVRIKVSKHVVYGCGEA